MTSRGGAEILKVPKQGEGFERGAFAQIPSIRVWQGARQNTGEKLRFTIIMRQSIVYDYCSSTSVASVRLLMPLAMFLFSLKSIRVL